MTLGTVKAPTAAQLQALADDLGFAMGEADLAAFGELMRSSIDAYNTSRDSELLPMAWRPDRGGAGHSGVSIRGNDRRLKPTSERRSCG